MKIEWASSFRSDGSRRRPPASTMHGWLAKMRGTLLGDESLRSKGMREMREARAARKCSRAKKRQVQSGRSLFGFFGTRKKPSRVASRNVGRGGSRAQQPNRAVGRTPRRPSGVSRGSSKSVARVGQSRPPQSRPRYNTARRASNR